MLVLNRLRILLLLCLAGNAAGQAPEPAAAPPASQAASAAAAYRTQDLDWVDAGRQRAVPVRLYWPAKVAAGAKLPLIIFSHGIGGSRQGYSYLGAYWSAQGVASLHVQHIGSDRQLWFGNPFGLVGRLQTAAAEGEALNRVRDISFALDQLLQGEHGAQIDRARIVAAGHSYGASTTMLLAGAQIARQGVALELRDARIKAAILISAPPFYGEADAATIPASIAIPTLHISATEDVITIPGYYSAASDRVALFEVTGNSAGRSAKAMAIFEGGSHSIFTDRAGTGGLALNPRVKNATKELSLAFLSHVFDASDAGLEQFGLRYRDILARWVLPLP